MLDRQAALRYVLSRHTPEGGYCFYRTPKWGVEEPNAPDTLAALESLRLLGVEPPKPERTERFLRRLQDEDGDFPTLTIGWAALRGLDALDAKPSRSPMVWIWRRVNVLLQRPAARDWTGAVTDLAHAGDLFRVTGAELDSPTREAFARMLEAARDPQGGWSRTGADLETTAVALHLLTQLGLQLGADARSGVEALFARSQDRTLGLCLGTHARAVSAGSLWGGLTICRMLGLRLAYPDAAATSLALLQRPDGGLGQRDRAISTLHDTWVGLDAARLLDALRKDRS
ncbi:prenyltransferase/squalene oxidase repeat-containing protein [Mycobacterium sp.]|uniref:prenyltransferase/squalene oxidase repeat-containing protein n=1 Tax=Mycobacterium sp. TaxID=1785 RepID=UPI002B651844|nr:prenyltransferase/squalene oxidase repeat-containing protein [Mycobacterium sp.]HTY30921.1 prenyltransferase/squalene oxidase repeat-containing protein [Mycobacterium sp.]